jgi:class 3 adenylate cyclase/tetratricopeptide (TPR) repeat protein
MVTPALLQTLASYVPPLIVRRLADDPAPITAPRAERFQAAVFFVDISGFTLLTEKLGQRGPAGAEELTRIINTYFAQLIDLIHAHGGEIIKFAGDALMALWPAHHYAVNTAPFPSPLHEATHRATQCGLAVIAKMNHYLVMENWYLYLKVGLGAGEVLAVNVGGQYGRWEFLVTGAPLSQMTLAEKTAQRGEVTLAPEAWALIETFSAGQILDNGVARADSLRLAVDPAPAPPVPPPPPEAEKALLAFIPRAITLRLAAGQTDWLAELRRVTVLFLTINGLDYAAPDALEQIQAVMSKMQEQLYNYEGSVRQFIVDDKGAVLIAALGLPPLAHEDDAARGLHAAIAMQTTLRAMGLQGAVGITTGQAFCGEVGSSHRREYALVGGVVILSARLMQAASQQGLDEVSPILCDTATYHAAQGQFDFEALPAIMVKGRAEPVAVYRPVLKTGPGPLGLRSAKVSGQLVGRATERAIIEEELHRLARNHTGGTLVIEGEPGIGKSRLAEHLRAEAEVKRLTVFSGAGDAVEKSTPYHAWRGVFAELFDLNVLGEPEGRRRHILDLLEETEPGLLRLAPLLNAVLPLDLIDNELTVQMQGQVRADNTRDLLLQLLQNAAIRSPKVIVMEDAQWLDSASWALLVALRQRTRAGPLLLAIVTRSLSDAAPAEYRELLSFRGTRHLNLDSLTPDETVTLACQCLGVTSLPDAVKTLLLEKGEGHPSFSEELAYTLRDTGLITIADGQARITLGAGDLRALNFPDTIQGMITSRIDRLPVGAQFALKTASIIGRTFALRTLQAIHPIEADRANLTEYLATLERLGLLAAIAPEPDLAYTFKHTITREVAYNLMLFSQRQKLHRAVAEWFEDAHAADLAPFYQLLAYHWSKADDALKAIFYLELSGEQALRTGAYQEAINFFGEALKIGEAATRAQPAAQNGEMISLREAAWERQIGEGYYGLGQLAASRDYLQRALTRLGYPLPASPERLRLSVFAQGIRQFFHLVWPRRFVGRQPTESIALALETARADLQLGLIATFYSEVTLAFFVGLRALNHAERGGPTPELARVYAYMSAVATVITLHDLARTYRRRAQAIARDVNDLPTLAYVELLSNQYTISFGQWEKARERYERALATCEAVGDQSNRGLGLISLALVFYLQGQFERSAELCVELYASALERDHTQHKGWGLFGQGMSLLRLGKTDQALSRLEQGLPLSLAVSDNLTQTAIHGLRATAYLRQGNLGQAIQAADEAAQILRAIPTASIYSAFDAYAGVAEVYLAHWETRARAATPLPEVELRLLKTQAQWACQTFGRYARAHPFARPRALVCDGWSRWLAGQQPQALRLWRQSLALAKQLGMPYDEGLVHYEIGRHAAGEEKQIHLKQASEIFERLGAAYDLERARAAGRQS